MDFEIIVSERSDGRADVRDNLGRLVTCDNAEHARIYCNGLQDGWKAASGMVGMARWNFAPGAFVQPPAEQAALADAAHSEFMAKALRDNGFIWPAEGCAFEKRHNGWIALAGNEALAGAPGNRDWALLLYIASEFDAGERKSYVDETSAASDSDFGDVLREVLEHMADKPGVSDAPAAPDDGDPHLTDAEDTTAIIAHGLGLTAEEFKAPLVTLSPLVSPRTVVLDQAQELIDRARVAMAANAPPHQLIGMAFDVLAKHQVALGMLRMRGE